MQRGQFGRREIIKLVGGAVVAWPGAAVAQAPGRLWKIGVLANESWPPLEGLRHGLRDLGYVEGKSHLFLYRFAQGDAKRFPVLASELVNLPVDLIVAWGTPASLAAHKATDTIPIVMSAGDPVGAGIVAGLAHPGGNVTGISVQMAEQEGKRLELLKKLLPEFFPRRGAVQSEQPLLRHRRRGGTARGRGIGTAGRSRGSIGCAQPRRRVHSHVLVVGVDGWQFVLDHFVRDAHPLARQKWIGDNLARHRGSCGSVSGGRADDLHYELSGRVPSTGAIHR
jgi:hypothetical protein